MSFAEIRRISGDALWRNNPALVQLLGLCPLLGVSNSAVNALGLGLATIAVLALSNLSVSLLRKQVPETVRLPCFMMIIASLLSCIEFLMQAYTYQLYTILGIFIPIIVTNCAILGRAEGFARRQPPLPALLDGLMTGLGFALPLLILGMMRELVGTGAVFADMHLLFGERASGWKFIPFPDYPGMLVAALPPGAFIFTGLLIAAYRGLDQKIQNAKTPEVILPGAKRVRVTGDIR